MNEETRKATDFGADVFGAEAIQKYLSKDAAKKLLSTIQGATPLDPSIAGEVAHGMKQWALERGATHYTHWFLPLTGSTAEKHDAFLEIRDGEPILTFSGKNLIVGEPDASSFPSGGIRSTFEARGYTAWDPTSPAFIKRHANGATLCIPTAFCAYTGEALDQKTPLLRSMQTLSVATKRLMKCFGKGEARVTITLGPEQEYFLIDKKYYAERPDLMLTGRTLFGAPSPKGQQLEDHYFGSIRARILNFMNEVEKELWKLGIPAKTRHNEVAPAQFELAPMFEELNLSCDHNMLVMEVLRQVADRNGLVCLLHEKPFAGVNGSGKHVNWSLSTDTGKNLFSPGKTPSQNALFLLLLAAFLKGVDDYQELLRCSVAFAGNDHRLGAQEAPPAIISVFLGTDLEGIIDAIVGDNNYTAPEHKSLRIGVDVLPSIPQDTTDRNRTSPLAFTGNKFEFRMPGSSQSIAGPITILNAIMADELDQFYETIKDASDFTAALHKLIRDTFSAHRRIIFSGNGYEDAWIREAEKRGLANLRNTAEALPTYLLPKNIEMLTRQGVYSREEILSRHEVHIEKYCKVIRIEAGTLVDMVQHGILNAVSEYEATLCNTIVAKHTAAPELTCHVESSLANAIGSLNEQLLEETIGLKTALETVSESFSPEQLLHYYHDEVEKRMDDVRRIIDKLEVLTASKYWPYPTFCELLFSV